MKTIEVGPLLDESRWSGYQKLLIFGTALTIILDGVDNQLMGPTIPTLMQEWNLPFEAFTHVLTAGPLGMMFGGLFGGMFGDRVGRRTALLSSVIAFAAVTLGISFVGDPTTLTVFRFLAGLGLGGATPNAAVLASEYVPRNRRAVAVTVTIVCVPLGGFIAAAAAARIIPIYGWERLWQLGGILPILLGIVLFKILPESPKYLANHPERWPELRRLLTRMGHNIPEDSKFVADKAPSGGAAPAKGSFLDLFATHRLRDTIGLWFAFFFCLMGNYLCIQWLPTMLTSPEVGFERSQANNILSVFNLGGVGGALLTGVLVLKIGSRLSMLTLSLLSIVGAIVLSGMMLNPAATLPLYIMIGYTGALMNAVQTIMYALAAHVYPTEIRGRGVGTAVAVGRVGHSLTGQLGPWAMGSGSQHYFLTWGYSMGIVFLALALVKRHIERNKAVVAGTRMESMSRITLEVFTDYVCPWCFLSTRRIEKLKQNYPIDVRLAFFPLHPDTPPEGLALERLFAGRNLDIAAMHARMKALMDAEGLPYGVRTHTYNSRLAQELGKWGDSLGSEAIHDALYRAYFADGRDISKVDVLIDIARSVGLPESGAKEVLENRTFKDAVDADWAKARAYGVTGVPTFVSKGQAVVGGQPYEVLERFVKQMGTTGP